MMCYSIGHLRVEDPYTSIKCANKVSQRTIKSTMLIPKEPIKQWTRVPDKYKMDQVRPPN